MTIINADGKFYSDEGMEGNTWYEITESSISYGIYTRKPDPETIEQMLDEINRAAKVDAERGDTDNNSPFPVLDYPTPNTDQVKAKWGDTWKSYQAYKDFETARIG